MRFLRIYSTNTSQSHDQKGIPKKTTPRLVLLLLKLWKAGLSFKKKLDYNEGVEERESDTCLRADVVLGLCGRLRRVAEGVCVDRGAGDGTLSCSRLELRNSGVVPSGCLIQVAANTHNKPEHICICDVTATWWIGSMRHTWPRTCSTCTTRCACASALWSRTARLVLPWPLTGADGPWMKPTETTPVAKPVGTFSAHLQLISQTCSVESPVFTFLLLLILFGFFFEEGLWQEWK